MGSGSRGNAFLIEGGDTRLLVDAGFSASQTARRLERLGVEPDSVDAVVVTHEHRDHTAGAGVTARRWGWPLYMTTRTATACAALLDGTEEIRGLRGGQPTRIGELDVVPVDTCHDAAQPVAVTVRHEDAGLSVGVATDIGRATAPVRYALRACNYLILEANHDERWLRTGPYPWSVKRRIGGSRGHLSNRLAAELLAELAHDRLAGVLLAHVSQECNDPGLALEEVGEALERTGFEGVLDVADQVRPSQLYSVTDLVEELIDGPQLRLFR